MSSGISSPNLGHTRQEGGQDAFQAGMDRDELVACRPRGPAGGRNLPDGHKGDRDRFTCRAAAASPRYTTNSNTELRRTRQTVATCNSAWPLSRSTTRQRYTLDSESILTDIQPAAVTFANPSWATNMSASDMGCLALRFKAPL